MRPTQLLYMAAGRPPVDAEPVAIAECWLCGAPGEVSVPLAAFLRSSTDLMGYASAPESDRVCTACIYCFAERCAELTRMTGRERPQKMRTYSHFVVGGRWQAFTKSDKARMLGLLIRGPFPELAVISDSQQRHLIFKARCNVDGGDCGIVQFEDTSVFLQRDQFIPLLEAVERLYHGGAAFSLALWLAQKGGGHGLA